MSNTDESYWSITGSEYGCHCMFWSVVVSVTGTSPNRTTFVTWCLHQLLLIWASIRYLGRRLILIFGTSRVAANVAIDADARDFALTFWVELISRVVLVDHVIKNKYDVINITHHFALDKACSAICWWFTNSL